MPPALLILQLVQVALTQAPKAIEIATKAKDLVAAMFAAKVITAAEQDAVFKQVDAICAMAQAGIVPDSWKVEPDPV